MGTHLIDPDARRRLHEAMAARVAAGRVSGVVTALAAGDEVDVDVIGTAEMGGGPPLRRDTPFRIASMTKPLLAATTMTLVEDGALDLAEPVDRLLPELAGRRVLARVDGPLDDTVPAGRPVTVEDLLTFRMGFGMITEPEFEPPHYPVVRAAGDLDLALGPPEPRTPHDPDGWLRAFATLPLLDQPGERWRYHAATLVLGVLVARAAGTPLAEAMAERVFEPLGMAHTGFHTTAEEAGRLPAYYMSDLAGGPVTRQDVSPPEQWAAPPVFPSGSAGLLSTVDDYLAFARMLLRGGEHGGRRVLAAESVRAMTTNHLSPEQIATAGMLLDPKGWGYGMAVAAMPDEMSAQPGRYGWDGGYGTVWFNDPSRDLTAIALTQTSDFLFDGGRVEFTRLALAAAPAVDAAAPAGHPR
jgi:CubicO group peptidase (beta-lactamase class C family)